MTLKAAPRTKKEETVSNPFQMIRLSSIKPSSTNPRKTFDEDLIKELSESINQFGIIQPLLVRPFPVGDVYELVAGERRFRAAALSNLQEIPCYIRELSDEEALECQIVENLQRKNVHPMDEAVAFKSLIEDRDLSIADVARKIGKNLQYVSRRYFLNMLIEDAKSDFFKNRINLGTALEISRLTEEDQKRVLEYIEGDTEVITSDVKSFIESNIIQDLSKACFNTKDAKLVDGKPACESCSLRSGYSKTLFHDIEQDDRCFDNKCFNLKTAAHLTKVFEKNVIKYPSLKLGTAYNSDNDLIDLLPKEISKTLTKQIYSHNLVSKAKACGSCNAFLSLNYGDFGKVLFKCCGGACPQKTSNQVSSNDNSESNYATSGAVRELELKLNRNEQLIIEKTDESLRNLFNPNKELVSLDVLTPFKQDELYETEELSALVFAHLLDDYTLGLFALRLCIELNEEEYTPADKDDADDQDWFDLDDSTVVKVCRRIILDPILWPRFKAIATYQYFRKFYTASYNIEKYLPIKLRAAKVLGFDMTEKIEEIKDTYQKKQDKLQQEIAKLKEEGGAK